jgi:hypothetical protein
MNEPVEQATANPGEKRNLTRDDEVTASITCSLKMLEAMSDAEIVAVIRDSAARLAELIR